MISELKEQIIKANEAYRIGKPIISDSKYDQLIDELSNLSPNDELLTKVGHTPQDESRKSRLPIEMASMNKLKSLDDINDWCRLKGISKDELVIITPKYDGLSLCVNEKTGDAFTRGDGQVGQKSNEHYKLIGNHLNPWISGVFDFTYGEVIMSKKTFIEKYSMDFANPRNLVAGLLNNKEATEPLKDCQYIKYGAISIFNFLTKKEILDKLNENQLTKVNYHLCKISDLTEEFLIETFKEFSIEYEIDGLIIEINDLKLQEQLGRETSSNNPVWARAYKSPDFEQSVETEIIKIDWVISKNGSLKPVARLKPVKLDGVTISNVTCNNARFVKDFGLGSHAVIKIVRSGMVIPKIVDVIKKVDFKMPDVPDIDWNENGIELITLTETDEQKLKKIIAFFEILEADNLSQGIITQLWEAGYKSVKDILNLTTKDLEKIDRFGKRKAQIVFNSIKKSTTNVSLSKLQHATGIFKGLGSKKLALLEHFTTKPTLEQVMSIEGFAEISAKSYIDSYEEFVIFVKDLPITILEKQEVEKVGNDLSNMIVVYTGIRDKNSECVIVSRGGKIGSSVNRNTTHIVCKDPNSGSSKLEKAKSLGVKIINLEDLNNLLKK